MGLNWGAGLQAAGQSLGQWAAYQQQLAHEEKIRQQQLADLAAANARVDAEHVRMYGPVIPPVVPAHPASPAMGPITMPPEGPDAESYTWSGSPAIPAIPAITTYPYAGVDLPRDQFAGQYAGQALDSYLQAHPIKTDPNAGKYPWTDPQSGVTVYLDGMDYYNVTHPKPVPPIDPKASFILQTPGGNVTIPGTPSAYETPNEVPTLIGSSGGFPVYSMTPTYHGADGEGDPNKTIKPAAEAMTALQLGGAEQAVKTDNKGRMTLTDVRYGGPAVTQSGMNNLPPEYPRIFQQAAADSMASNPAWINPSNWDALGQDITGKTIPAIPSDWTWDEKKKRFTQDIPKHLDPRVEAEQFFREHVMPQMEGKNIGEASWARLKSLADKYGLSNEARARLGFPPGTAPIDKSLLEDALGIKSGA